MKNILLFVVRYSGIVALILIAVCCAMKRCATSSSSIGILNEQEIVAKSNAFKVILGEEQKYNNALSARQAEDEKMLQNELVALDKKIKESGKPQSAYQKEIEQFQQKVAFYNRKYQVQRNLIARAAQAARQQLDPFVQETLNELTQRGYTVIVSKTQVMNNNPKADITADFIKILDAKKIKIVFPDPVQFAVAQSAIAQQAAEKVAAKTGAEVENAAPVAKTTEPAKSATEQVVKNASDEKKAPVATTQEENKETKK